MSRGRFESLMKWRTRVEIPGGENFSLLLHIHRPDVLPSARSLRRIHSVQKQRGGDGARQAIIMRDSWSRLRCGCANVIASCAKRLDPETAIRVHLLSARQPFFADNGLDRPVLKSRLWGMDLDNPIGLSAGFDKNAESVDGLHAIGFGFVEVGTVTPLPQDGNPRPRIVRLEEDKAFINRYNPSAGHAAVARNLESASRRRPCGINIGPMAGAADAEADFVAGVRALGPLADYLVVNVSNPTVAHEKPASSAARHEAGSGSSSGGGGSSSGSSGVSGGGGGSGLSPLLRRLRSEVNRLSSAGPHATPSAPPALILKVGPHLGAEEVEAVVREARAGLVDGVMVANASLRRPSSLRFPAASAAAEAGGLTGPPLRDDATALLRQLYRGLKGTSVQLVGLGGVSTGADAYARIRSGASAVQLYTAFAYDGLSLLPEIKRELADLLEADGFGCVADAVGVDVPSE